MAHESVSRRALLPTVASVTSVLALTEQQMVEAAKGRRRYMAIGGPVSLTRNQALVSSYFLPAIQRPTGGPSPKTSFELHFFTLDGKQLASDQQVLLPGTGAKTTIQAMGDGSVFVAGKMLNFTIPEGVQVDLVAILIGLLLPAIQNPAATLQGFDAQRSVNGDGFTLGPAAYLLPYVEQGN